MAFKSKHLTSTAYLMHSWACTTRFNPLINDILCGRRLYQKVRTKRAASLERRSVDALTYRRSARTAAALLCALCSVLREWYTVSTSKWSFCLWSSSPQCKSLSLLECSDVGAYCTLVCASSAHSFTTELKTRPRSLVRRPLLYTRIGR